MVPLRLFILAIVALLVALVPAEAASKKKKPAPAPASAPAEAPTPKGGAAQPLGQSGSWTAYQAQDGTGLVCYVMAQPQKSEPAGSSRKAMAMVTHRPGEKIANVVSFVEGYPLKEGSDASLDIGATKFHLPVAWLGSTITGKCESSFKVGTAARSSVLRYCVSKVLIPRSHNMTF